MGLTSIGLLYRLNSWLEHYVPLGFDGGMIMFSWLYYRFLLCAGSMLGFQIIPRQGMLHCLLFLVHVHGDGICELFYFVSL